MYQVQSLRSQLPLVKMNTMFFTVLERAWTTKRKVSSQVGPRLSISPHSFGINTTNNKMNGTLQTVA